MLAAPARPVWAAAVLASALMVSAQPAAQAQQTSVLRLAKDTASAPDFVEAYNNKRNVSGQRLAGVRIGRASPALDVGRLYLATGGVPAGSRICVRSTTSDASYWALNPYETAPPGSALAQLDYPTKFEPELAGYDGAAFALRAIVSPDCTEDSIGDIVPFALDPTAPFDALTVFVNAAEPLAKASLKGADGSILAASKCTKVEGPRQAFGWVCELPLAGSTGASTVALTVDLLTATGRKGKPIEARILLPGDAR